MVHLVAYERNPGIELDTVLKHGAAGEKDVMASLRYIIADLGASLSWLMECLRLAPLGLVPIPRSPYQLPISFLSIPMLKLPSSAVCRWTSFSPPFVSLVCVVCVTFGLGSQNMDPQEVPSLFACWRVRDPKTRAFEPTQASHRFDTNPHAKNPA